MKIFHAILISFLITGLIANSFFLFSLIEKKSLKEVKIARVIDGDTVVTTDGEVVRLLNINSPEKGEPGYQEALFFLKKFENKTLRLDKVSNEKYGRSLGRLYSKEYLNLEIVKRGFASKFLVHESELIEFSEAEEKAIKGNLGKWKKSSFYGCIILTVEPKKEIVKLKNLCSEISINGWRIKDESRKEYIFSNYTLGSKQEVNLHSGYGKNNQTDLFWNQKRNVWNDDRDTAYLYDSDWQIVSFKTYGY